MRSTIAVLLATFLVGIASQAQTLDYKIYNAYACSTADPTDVDEIA